MHREQFALGEGIYLLNHSVGRPPVTAQAAATAGFFEPCRYGAGRRDGRFLRALGVG